MSPSTFILPVMKALIPSRRPSAISGQMSLVGTNGVRGVSSGVLCVALPKGHGDDRVRRLHIVAVTGADGEGTRKSLVVQAARHVEAVHPLLHVVVLELVGDTNRFGGPVKHVLRHEL